MTSSFDVIAHYNYIDLDPRLAGMPRHPAAAWGRYRFALDNLDGRFTVGAGTRWMSSFRDGDGPKLSPGDCWCGARRSAIASVTYKF